MPKSKHDIIAERTARRLKAEYNPTKGPDVVTEREVDEVEIDKNTLKEGMGQMRGYRQLKYIVVPTNLVKDAKDATKGTKIGVRDEHGRIRKSAKR